MTPEQYHGLEPNALSYYDRWNTEYMVAPCYISPVYASDAFANVPSTYEIAGSFFDSMNENVRRIIKQSIKDGLQTAQPARKKNEDELSAGDTKLLDEYLHSFMQPGA